MIKRNTLRLNIGEPYYIYSFLQNHNKILKLQAIVIQDIQLHLEFLSVSFIKYTYFCVVLLSKLFEF